MEADTATIASESQQEQPQAPLTETAVAEIPAEVPTVVEAVAAVIAEAAQAPAPASAAPTAVTTEPAAASSPVTAPQTAAPSSKTASDISAIAEALDSALTMNDFRSAKSFLLKSDSAVSGSLYEHLSHVLLQILQQKPQNALDVFESISSGVKRNRLQNPNVSTAVQPVKEPAVSLESARSLKKLLESNLGNNESGEGNGDIPDIMDLSNIFEWAGVSLGREETFRVFLAIKHLVSEKKLKSARLFGKMFGLQKDYIIVESERRDDEDEEQQSEEQRATSNDPSDTPSEQASGANKYIYWVTSEIGTKWTRLPDVSPKHIQSARIIRKLLTGELSTKIVSYPLFDGTEAHYLRAQIARIAAATVISPNEYYKFDDEAEDGKPAVVLNTEFEWPTHDAMVSLDAWVHHIPHILPQGRTVWIDPKLSKKQEGEENEDEENGEEGEPSEPETGPELLTALTEDSELPGGTPAWSVQLTSKLSPIRYAPVCLRSNRWPGAVTVGYNEKFANIYVGWGLKELGRPFVPAPLAAVQSEYGIINPPPEEAGLQEATEVSLEDEKAYNDANKADDDVQERKEAEEEEDA